MSHKRTYDERLQRENLAEALNIEMETADLTDLIWAKIELKKDLHKQGFAKEEIEGIVDAVEIDGVTLEEAVARQWKIRGETLTLEMGVVDGKIAVVKNHGIKTSTFREMKAHQKKQMEKRSAELAAEEDNPLG